MRLSGTLVQHRVAVKHKSFAGCILRVLVIGGCGYLGSRLVPHLARQGHDVSVVDLQWFGNHLPESIPVTKGDARDLTVEDLEGVNCLIFLAGLSNDPMADHDPFGNYVANAALPAYLARIAAQAGVLRFIHGGSCSVYGMSSEFTMFESDECNAATPYGVSKYMAEIGCLQQSGAMSVINFRQGTVAGWSPRMRFDLVVNAMVRDALTKQVISVNDPNAWRPILAIDDAIRAYSAAVSAPFPLSGTYNIASENVTVLDIAETVRRLLATNVEIRVGNMPDCRSYRVNVAKARAELRWSPLWNVKQVAESVLEQCYLLDDFERDEFYNIRMFKAMRGSKLVAVRKEAA